MSRKSDEDVLSALSGLAPTDSDQKKSEQLKKIAEQRAVDEHGRDRTTRNILSVCLNGPFS